MITAKISIDCPVALQKGARKMAGHSFLRFLLHAVCAECFGQGENVGTLFNDPTFSSVNPLTALSTLGDAARLLSWPLVCNTGRRQGQSEPRTVYLDSAAVLESSGAFLIPVPLSPSAQNPDSVGSSGAPS